MGLHATSRKHRYSPADRLHLTSNRKGEFLPAVLSLPRRHPYIAHMTLWFIRAGGSQPSAALSLMASGPAPLRLRRSTGSARPDLRPAGAAGLLAAGLGRPGEGAERAGGGGAAACGAGGAAGGGGGPPILPPNAHALHSATTDLPRQALLSRTSDAPITPLLAGGAGPDGARWRGGCGDPGDGGVGAARARGAGAPSHPGSAPHLPALPPLWASARRLPSG